MNHNIIVISGPSGSGKSTLINMLLKKHPEIVFSTSHTTRPRRPKETKGKEYHFVSEEEFQKMIDDGQFVEWAQVYRNYYGTSLKEIENKMNLADGHVLVLDIDVQGARNIQEKFPYGLFIFIVPPSLETLEKRLVGREKKVDENIRKRLEVAREELKQYHIYDYIVVNDKLDDAFEALNSIYIAHGNCREKRTSFMENILRQIAVEESEI